MGMGIKKLIIVLIVGIVGFGGFTWVAMYLRQGYTDSQCQDNMIQIMNKINVYRHLNDKYPPDWRVIEQVGNRKLSELPCPGAVANGGSGPSSASSDYIYVRWSKQT